ncbi:MAG: PRD domain-containing protein [Bifidobacteriaceae bacterium]|jgi:beta-glucoside operon transcriptional antiterminator|nr:PRD domain-containing protein [Bifidobacteriaceae bacterium]
MTVIEKVLNNNAVLVGFPDGQKVVAVGKGIAYQRHAGDEILLDDSSIQIYKNDATVLINKLSELLDGIPVEHVKVSNEIIANAKTKMGKVDERVLLSLIDHLSFAIERYQKGIEFYDTLWELQSLYPEEFTVAKESLDIISNRLGVRLPDSEASFIAFHFVAANTDGLGKARDSMRLIKGILDIVETDLPNQNIRQSPKFSRFMTHLKYLAGLILNPSGGSETNKSLSSLHLLFKNVKVETKIVDRIGTFLRLNYQYTMSDDDRNYLILHLHEVTKYIKEQNG